MSKKTKRQKKFEEKHYYAHYSNEFLRKRFKFPINGQRFKIDRFRRTVNKIKSDLKQPFFSNPRYMMKNGVGYDGGTKKFSILFSFN